MGIPCIYYGSEQGFDSGGRPSGSDLVLRESMFGGRFGGLCTQGRHFFNEDGNLYRALADTHRLTQETAAVAQRQADAASHFRRRRQLRTAAPTWADRMRSLVSWSRLFIDQEVLIAVNTDEAQSVTAWSTVAPRFESRETSFILSSGTPRSLLPRRQDR